LYNEELVRILSCEARQTPYLIVALNANVSLAVADQAVAVDGYDRNVVRDESVGSRENLLLAAIRIETDETVCRRHRHRPGSAIRHDAVDTENVIIFHMRRAPRLRVKKIEPTVGIANPNAPASVCGQRRNIPIAENGGTRP
jgi:hypothetical protein